MKESTMSTPASFPRRSFLLALGLLAAYVHLLAPMSVGAVSEEKRLKEVLAEVRAKDHPPVIVKDPNMYQSKGIMFNWGLPQFETKDGRSLTLPPLQGRTGADDLFPGFGALDGTDPLSSNSPFNASNPLLQRKELTPENPFAGPSPFGRSGILKNLSSLDDTKTFGSRPPERTSDNFGTSRRLRPSREFGSSRRIRASGAFGSTRSGKSSQTFGQYSRAQVFDGSSTQVQSASSYEIRPFGNTGLSGRPSPFRSSLFNSRSPFSTTTPFSVSNDRTP